MNTKKELFGIELQAYLNASKKKKGEILDSLSRQTGMWRESIMRSFKRLQMESVYFPKKKRNKRCQEPFFQKKIYASDINTTIKERIQEKFPRVSIVAPSEIHKQSVDIFSPCALNHALNTKTVAELKCRIIVGGANNQLENKAAGDMLFDRGILYAPDYVVNAGGLISVYDEYEHPGKYDRARVEKKVLAIKDTLRRILSESASRRVSANHIANEMAEKIFNNK